MTSRLLAFALLLAVAGPAPAADSSALAIPFRASRLVVDADPADWGDWAARFVVERPPVPGEPTARAEVRLAWDRRALWALFEVADPTVRLAPRGISGPELFQWDSVEIYVDGQGERATRMGVDDFQVILAPDGRYAVLQGDPLLLELEELAVPKRERPAVAIEAAGRRRADGYVVECAVPFAALGIAPRTGATVAFDLGLNDWLDDHPPLRQLAYDLETLRKLDQRSTARPVVYTANGLVADTAEDVERRLYRPWSLAGSADFGHPRGWRPAVLTGRPAFAEAVVETLGARWTLAGGALSALGLVGLAVAVEERRHRRRIAQLISRLAALEAILPPSDETSPAPSPVAAPGVAGLAPAAPPDPLEWLEHAADRTASASGSGERLEIRAMRVIRERLANALSPGELADAVFVSPRSLQRHLAAALGCSPGELIVAVKMREARRLLERGDIQVQEVARRVGYDDPAHFSRRFKAYFELTPAAVVPSRAAHRGARLPAA